MKYIEQKDGSYISDLSCMDDGFIEGGTDWDGDTLISISDDIEIVYDESRLWRESIKNIGRNDKCPCNSGKKYKKCCINKEEK
tara:strand:+ start:373 stop:621 length:249 start_codon:yes stop_codon:yes gene_type:complete